MPPRAWSEKRERQYEHIKDSLEDRGTSEDKAEEIAARTVNKERASGGRVPARREGRLGCRARTCLPAAAAGFARARVARRGARATSSTKRRSTWASRAARR